MGIKQIIAQESDTASERAIRIPFEFTDTSAVPEGRKMDEYITITPLTVRTWFRLKPLLLAIEPDDLARLTDVRADVLDPAIPEIMNKYDRVIMSIVCTGIHNKKSEPPAWFREVLEDNCTWEDTRILLNAILFRLNHHSFYKSIMTLRSMSPLTGAEIIAARKNMESWITP